MVLTGSNPSARQGHGDGAFAARARRGLRWMCSLVAGALLAACAEDAAPRCEVGDAPLTLRGTEVRDQFVRLDLEYSGGCEDHAFAVWWSGVAGASDPPDVELMLQHDDRGDRCEALVQRSIWVDLSPLHEIMLGTDHVRVRFDGLPGVVEYSFAAPAAPPAADVVHIDQTCAGG